MTRLSMRVLIAVGFFTFYPAPLSVAQNSQRKFRETTPSLKRLASNDSATRGTCPGTGDCCVGHGGVGCNDFDCCDSVCFIDGFCCEEEWDANCAAFAAAFCPSLCQTEIGCGQGDCCAANSSGCGELACCELVCNADLTCCLVGWTPQCSALATELCESCQPVIECPQAGDCCQAHFGSGGCERAACCQSICEADPTCCTGSWGLSCARAARETCLNVCECDTFGDFDLNPQLDLHDAASMLNCHSGTDSATVLPPCACADYDGDGDSDLADFSIFSAILNGP